VDLDTAARRLRRDRSKEHTAMTILYLAAITAANLLAARFGPAASVPVAFALIGLDLTCRDTLHDRWHRRRLWPKMAALITAGSVLSWAVQPAAGRVAVASAAAFAVAATLDAVTYHLLGRRPRPIRVNGSNLAGAAADSLVFPTLAFGGLLPLVVAGQFAAKALGGLVWSLLLGRRRAGPVGETG